MFINVATNGIILYIRISLKFSSIIKLLNLWINKEKGIIKIKKIIRQMNTVEISEEIAEKINIIIKIDINNNISIRKKLISNICCILNLKL